LVQRPVLAPFPQWRVSSGIAPILPLAAKVFSRKFNAAGRSRASAAASDRGVLPLPADGTFARHALTAPNYRRCPVMPAAWIFPDGSGAAQA
jgi:hypothetical protein